ncbi:MAG: NAD(P)-dependent oxidoreductase [Deinococcota bacterium]|nr:NAD(P)-dependent oxidoreductase [Deinococcota bacterium]
MRVLVTGSSGFIGSHLLERLLAEGHTALGLDHKPPVNPAHEAHVERCDLLERAGLTYLVSAFAPEAVIHLAARTDLDEKVNIGGYAANTVGVENLLAAIRETPAVRRALFTSSQLVCGVGYLPRHDQDYAPSTLYGESKVLTEKLVRGSDGAGREWCLLRPTTVWGPGMLPHYQKFLGMIQRGGYFHVGRRPLYKSYGYVGNIVYQYQRMLAAPAEEIQRRVFYLADYEPLSLRAWADAFQREFGAKPIKTYPETLVRAAARMGDAINALGYSSFPFNSFRLNNVLTEYTFDLSDTEAVCGPLPHTVSEGVKETAAWFSALQNDRVGRRRYVPHDTIRYPASHPASHPANHPASHTAKGSEVHAVKDQLPGDAPLRSAARPASPEGGHGRKRSDAEAVRLRDR